MKRAKAKTTRAAHQAPPDRPSRQDPPVPEPRSEREAAAGGTGLATKLSSSVGVVAAMVLATLLNIFVARHYRRWDVTRGGLYTLSEATVTTLRGVSEPIGVHVLLPSGEALTVSVAHLLDEYRAKCPQLAVDFVDPDRRPAEFLALARRYGLDAQKADGRIVAGAAAVVTRGDRFEIVQQQDLVRVEDEDDLRMRPRLEQAITGAIRAVTSTEHTKACFTAGHGELDTQALRAHLVRSGYAIEPIDPKREGAPPQSLDGCTLLVIAGPTERIAAVDVARFESYVAKGGSAFVAVGARPDGSERGYSDYGLAKLLEAVGLKLDPDFVFEGSAEHRLPTGRGEVFQPKLRPHAVTQRLLRGAERGLFPVVAMASSLSPIPGNAAATTPVLVTSDDAFGMVDFFTWALTNTAATKTAADKPGPLTIAAAAELPKPPAASHGGRVVAIGTSSVLVDENWAKEGFRGTAVFVEGAIGWLTERPVLDIPDKPVVSGGLRVSDEWLANTFRYVVVYMPLASILLGVAMHLRRRDHRKRTLPGDAR